MKPEVLEWVGSFNECSAALLMPPYALNAPEKHHAATMMGTY